MVYKHTKPTNINITDNIINNHLSEKRVAYIVLGEWNRSAGLYVCLRVGSQWRALWVGVV